MALTTSLAAGKLWNRGLPLAVEQSVNCQVSLDDGSVPSNTDSSLAAL